MPLQKTEKETIAFLQQASGRVKHQIVWDGAYRSYSLEGPSFHIEYKIAGDTCVMAGIQFLSNSNAFTSFVREVMAQTKPFGANRLKEIGGRKLIYVLNSKGKAITVATYSFAIQKVKSLLK